MLSMVLADDINGDGTLDLLVSTMSGEVQSSLLHLIIVLHCNIIQPGTRYILERVWGAVAVYYGRVYFRHCNTWVAGVFLPVLQYWDIFLTIVGISSCRQYCESGVFLLNN